jgi:type IV pilus assembly protein PilB
MKVRASVKRICAKCKEEFVPTEEMLMELALKPENVKGRTFYRGKGCDACNKTGYKGRIAIYEVMNFVDELKEFVINGSSAAELKAEAIRLGMQTLRMAALNKLKEGFTTIDEVTRVSAHD